MIDLETTDFQKMFSQTLKNRKDRLYQWMVGEFLKQNIPATTQYCFDQAICLDQHQSLQRHSLIEKIRIDLEGIFRLRAFVPIDAHLLTLPLNDANTQNATSLQPFTLLDPSGIPITLPLDLRQNFARFCVRNGISRMKRYSFGKVFSKNDPT
uniref:Uncharacterized protein n=1 Tax=Acrobeloides nanus TaxID=290746 RepID=A0A914DG61_9BILA